MAEDKCIGRLTLDISQVKNDIKEVNEWLGKIGANINLEDKLSQKISSALKSLVNEAKKAGEEASKAASDAISKSVNKDELVGLESKMKSITSVVEMVTRTTEDGMGKVVSTIVKGFDEAGNKITEFSNQEGEITKRTQDITSAVDEAVKMYLKLFEVGTKINDMEAKGDTKSTAYLKATQEAAKLYQQLGNINEETLKAARATQEYTQAQDLFNAATEMAEQRVIEAKQKESAEIDKLVQKTEQSDARKAESAERAAKRAEEAAEKAAQKEIEQRERVAFMYRQMFDELEKKDLSNLVSKYQDYYKYETMSSKAIAGNDFESADLYSARAKSLWEEIAAIEAANPKLAQMAGETKEVAKAVREWQEADKASQHKYDVTARQEEINKIKLALDDLIAKYQEYYSLESQKINAVHNGEIDNADMYRSRAQALWEEISAIEEANPRLAEMAAESDKVTTAVQKWQSTANSGVTKVEKLFDKQNQDNITNYARALEKLYNEQAKLNNVVATGNIKEGSEEYTKAQQKIKDYEKAVVDAGEKLDATGIKVANSMTNVVAAADTLVQSQAKMRDASQVSYLEQVQSAYNNLVIAIRNYNTASKSKNEDGMRFWKEQIDGSMALVRNIEKEISSLKNADAQFKDIVLWIERAKTEQDGFNKEINKGVKNTGDIESQFNGLITRMFSLMAVIRTINNLISNTVEYVSEYSQKMNEIQIITQKSSSEVAQLSETYRSIAKEMSVSSLEMADAAIYFTRQGLKDADIEERLKNTTMYAKTANIEFTRAAELITAVVNSMGLVEQEAEDGRKAAQRVADVFLKVGDSAATSGEEIGEAMQKAAAAAGSFGVSFEWLAAYIASVSETTRQEARTIGTALNTIIARLHSIRSSGYNSEDETKLNDVQKALNNINVSLMDQEGQWRDMTDVFNDVASVWDTLDDKTKSYIATTMAGVKQQNVFLALMNDLSKGVENGSRAWELYNIAMNSAGTASSKYEIYTDSVTAAQDRLNIAQEKFYSLLDSNVIKSWYDTLAGVVDFIADGTEKLGGLNLILPVAIGLVSALVVAFNSLSASAAKAGAASISSFIIESHPLIAIISVVGMAILALTALGDALSQSKKRFEEASQAVAQFNKDIEAMQTNKVKLADMFEDIGHKTKLSAEDLANYNGLLESLSSISPIAKGIVDDLKNGFIDQETAVKQLNEEIDKYILNTQRMSAMELMKKFNNYQSDNVDIKGYSNWDQSWFGGKEGEEGFRNALQEAYHQSWMWDQSPFSEHLMTEKYMSDEIYTSIMQWLENGISWDSIAKYVWGKMFQGDSSYNIEQATAKEANKMIDDVMALVAQNMGSADSDALRVKLTSMLFNQDGGLRVSEVGEIASMMSDFVADALDKSFDPNMLLSSYDKMVGIAKSLFGELSQEIHSGLMQLYVDDPEAANQIADSYDRLLKAGLSRADIRDIFSEIPVNEWATAYTDYIDQVAHLVERNIQAHTEDWDFNIWDFFGDELAGDVDLETLDLLDSLASAEVEIQRLKEATKDVTSINGLKEALRGLAKEAGVEVPEGTSEGTKTLQDFTKEAKAAKSEITSLDSLYNKVIKNGKMTVDDALGFPDHPELLTLVGQDLDAILQTINEIKKASLGDFVDAVKGIMWNDKGYAKRSPFAQQIEEAGVETLQQYRDLLEETGGDFSEIDTHVNETADKIMGAADKTEEAAITWLEAQAKIASTNEEVNWAKSNHFADQIALLTQANENGGIQEAINLFEGWDEEMQKAILSEYPSFIKLMGEARKSIREQGKDIADLTKTTKAFGSALNNATKINEVKYFTDTAKAVKQLSEGTINVTDAYKAFDKEASKVTKAYEDILKYEQKLKFNAAQKDESKKKDITTNDVTNLASLLNMTAEEVLQNYPEAVNVFNELTGAAGEFQSVLEMLNKEAFIKITGASEADFSNIINGLVFVEDEADKAVKKLLATGQWTVEKMYTNGMQDVFENGKIVKKNLVGEYGVLKPAPTNPLYGSSSVADKSGSTSSGRKSGGGGGGSKDKNNNFRDSNVSTEVERMLDLMSQVNTIQGTQQNYYQSQQKYYSQTGQLQGVIAYMQKESEVLKAQNPILEENIRKIEDYMAQKRAEIATLSTDDEKYKEVADDLDKLQKAHQTYTKQLVDNKTAIDQLTESIKEQQKKIRQMEIDLRNTILKAIQDREAKKKNMLTAEIQMENTIFEIIKKRYETERDEIIETNNLRIDALKQERDLLDEQLRIRKEQAEAEDKQLKLRELEAKYQRILADPTRRKEAQSIKSEIDALRKEMAWDLAENEVKAQQEAIDQQITSLEDYIEYVENYYEDLFEHPQKLIAEMRDIMALTQSEIIEWLKTNDETYRESSENTQLQMVNGWNETYNEMKGILITYWDEVEEIIAQGDDYIIEFLKNNASEYAEAGKLQAEAYVDEWKKQLDDLHKAYQSVTAEVAANYDTIKQYTGSASNSSSSSGGGSGKGGGNTDTTTTNTTTTKQEEHGFSVTVFGKKFSGRGVQYGSAEGAKQRGLYYINQEANKMLKLGTPSSIVEQEKRAATQSMTYYKEGGIADFTGPAWVDGSKERPERILNPYQTQLFETMVEALDRMSHINVASMPNFGNVQTAGGGNVSVGDIIVNVENLDTDDDYEELADKVSEVLMDRLGRSAVVGGLRIRST